MQAAKVADLSKPTPIKKPVVKKADEAGESENKENTESPAKSDITASTTP